MYDYTSSYGSSGDDNKNFSTQIKSGENKMKNSGNNDYSYTSGSKSNSNSSNGSSYEKSGNTNQSNNMQNSNSQKSVNSAEQSVMESMENKKREENISVLNEVYQVSVMGKQAISNIIPKVNDQNFKKQLLNNYENYEEICSKSTSEIMKMGEKPREKNPLSKVMLWGAINMNTIVDNSCSSLANMIIKGSHNGISNMTRALNRHSSNIDENVKSLADDYMKIEESNIDGLQKFL